DREQMENLEKRNSVLERDEIGNAEKTSSLERKSLYDQYVKTMRQIEQCANKVTIALKKKNKRIARLQAEIAELESIVNEPPPEVNMSGIQRQL
ncbi:11920_t:CDS:2, partial [Ambispora gerdemannii]